jgi:hypothetical protein
MFLLFAFTLIGCNSDDETEYSQFNDSEDSLVVDVGTEEELDPVETDLHSSTGQVVVGWAQVSPGGGPIGTEHEIVVIVDDDYEDLVDRVSVRTDSGDRGEDEYDLEPDSADEGYYVLGIVSVGEDGETRSDTLSIRLWQEVESEDDSESTDEEEEEEEEE